MFETYLGDGVYAVWCNGVVTLDLRAQGSDRIVLEPHVRLSLNEFCESCALKAMGEVRPQ